MRCRQVRPDQALELLTRVRDAPLDIKKLVDEEQALHSAGGPDSRARLETVRVELDQCWDLLRQRRALREFGNDPGRGESAAAERSGELRVVDFAVALMDLQIERHPDRPRRATVLRSGVAVA